MLRRHSMSVSQEVCGEGMVARGSHCRTDDPAQPHAICSFQTQPRLRLKFRQSH